MMNVGTNIRSSEKATMLRPRPGPHAVLDKAAMTPVRHVLHDGETIAPRNMDSLVKVGNAKQTRP